MTDDLHDRVREVLEEAERRIQTLDDEDVGVDEELQDVVERANEIVSNNGPAELLNAVGSEDLSEGEKPDTIPEAIEKSSPETVVTLRRLLALSKMADADDDDAFAEHAETFRKLSEEHDGTAESGERETAEDSDQEAVEDSSEAEDSDQETDSGEETGGAEQFRKSLLDGIEEFREGIRTTRAELEGEGEEPADEDEEAKADEDDGPSNRDGTMFSTVPSSGRADMRGSTRFSTVRKK